MNEEQKIVDALHKSAPALSTTEKEDLWRALEGKLSTAPAPIPSPYLSFFNTKKHMAPIALALILMLGTTGVVAASNDARPGDTLFLVDQTVEDVRLALASNDSKTRLEAQFAAERLIELSSILEESVNKSAATASASTTSSFEAEADVFADVTIVKVEINDRKTVFASNAKTREAIVAEISTRYGVPTATVEAKLDFEIEDRASRDDERDTLTISQENEVRVNNAVAITLGYLLNGSFGDDEREDLLEELSHLIDGVPVKLDNDRLRIKDTNTWVEVRTDDDDSRVEIRDGNDRIRVREKDGEIRIDTKGDWDDLFEDKDDSDDRDDDRDDDDRDDNSNFEAEADVFIDTTIVEVEINGRKTVFETSADTRAGVVAEIVRRFGVASATVEAALDFEIETRASRPDDSDDATTSVLLNSALIDTSLNGEVRIGRDDEDEDDEDDDRDEDREDDEDEDDEDEDDDRDEDHEDDEDEDEEDDDRD